MAQLTIIQSDRTQRISFRLQGTNPAGERVSQTIKAPDGFSGWSKKPREKYLAKLRFEFDLACANGSVQSKSEKAEANRLAAIEALKIKTLRQFSEQAFLPSKTNLAERSRDYYDSLLKNHIYPYFNNGLIELSEISAADIRAFLTDFDTKISPKTKKPYAYSTKHGCFVTLNCIFAQAYNEEIISSNPCAKVRFPARNKDDEVKVTALSDEQIERFFEALQNEPLEWQTLFSFSFDCGVRAGEVAGLKWQHLNLEDNCASIENNLINYKGKLLDRRTKNGHSRTVYFTENTKRLFKQWQTLQVQTLGIGSYIFTAETSLCPLEPDRLNKRFVRICKRCGIYKPGMHFHQIRHTFGSVSANSGIPIILVRNAMGHNDISTTSKYYIDVDLEAQKNAAQQYFRAIGFDRN